MSGRPAGTAGSARIRTWAPLAAATLVVAAAGGTPDHASAAPADAADRQAMQRGATWLARTPTTMAGGQLADSIVAIRAAGRPPAVVRPRLRALARVGPRYATTAGASAKVVLGAVAAGADPTRLGGRDYVRGVNARYAGGRYGESAFDQALAILALTAAERPVPRAAIRASLAARGQGGWSFGMTPAGRDSVDATGLMIEALRAAGVPARHPALWGATAWMVSQRNGRGGYASAGRGGPTEANPTANAVRALRAMGRPVPPATRAELRRLQARSGAVRFTATRAGSPLLATNDAVIAFSGRTLPVR
jgi:hypothetical protein